MRRHVADPLDRRQLLLVLALFFSALALPGALLVQHAWGRIEWEVFHQYQGLAEEQAAGVDLRLAELVREEEARSFADYAFLVVAGVPEANFLQRSPLAAFPPGGAIPGLIGHFQVDSEGALSTPLLPEGDGAELGLGADELAARHSAFAHMQSILVDNELVATTIGPVASVAVGTARKDAADTAYSTSTGGTATVLGEVSADARAGAERDTASITRRIVSELASLRARDSTAKREQVPAQAAFDELQSARAARGQSAAGALGRVEDLVLGAPPAQPAAPAPAVAEAESRTTRKEASAVPELQAVAAAPAGAHYTAPAPRAVRVSTFESELDPFEFSLLGSGHFVLFRKVWRNGQRYIQGALIDRPAFLRGTVVSAFGDSTLARSSELVVAWQGAVLAAFGSHASQREPYRSDTLTGTLLYRARLSAPLADLELLYTVRDLPAGPGARVLAWVAGVFALVLCGGFALMYRLGARQIDLARQQQDFVAAVSHELKTPLTSIRMYGEMLREGWVADDSKRRGYYDFIVNESERLSRLIGNVLQLARMTRNDLEPHRRAMSGAEVLELARAKTAAHVERAGFTLVAECDDAARELRVSVDADWLSQIVINLVDNAVKFSASAARRQVDLRCHPGSGGNLRLSVRDYGPGVPRGQARHIFKLFYRSGSELTRESTGTGIGLALVRELAGAMDAGIELADREPGAEFILTLPATSTG